MEKQKKTDRVKKQSRLRLIIQVLAAALFNGYVIGFAKGKIFTGPTKAVCVPVLNCYSCPGALGACPIGALQAVLGGKRYSFSFYVLGLIMLFGVVLGRLICGFLCPFGLLQDLLHKIPVRKVKVPRKVDGPLRWLKYVLLVLLVFLLPIFLRDRFGIGAPYFCKWVCPAGILEGALPLIAKNSGLRAGLGFLFSWKFAILLIVIVLSTMIYRPFCKYICPLGGFYGLFNKFALFQMRVDKDKCIGCGKCVRECPMEVDVLKNINSRECIRCGRCKSVCPTEAISAGFFVRAVNSENQKRKNEE
ncbi:MAG: 4Fe-4S binding protein [Candidatus Limivicinus sp.]